MKKILLLLTTFLFTATCMAQIQEAEFDFDNNYATLFPSLKGVSSGSSNDGDITEATTATVNGVNLTVSKSTTNTANRIWSSSPRLRIYGGTLTITAPTGTNICEIEFKGKWNNSNSVDVGSLANDGANQMKWTGASQTVVLTVAANTQLKEIDVEYTSGNIIEAPEIEGEDLFTTSTTISMSAAAGMSIYYTLDGTTPDLTSTKYTAPFTITETTTIKAIASDGTKTSTVETETFIKKAQVVGQGTLEDPYTCKDALALTTGMQSPTTQVYVKGIVCKIDNLDVYTGATSGAGSYGNATYEISDDGTEEAEFEIFRGYYLGGEKFTSADQLKVGDQVVVLGKILLYNNETPEMTQGSEIISINGATTGINDLKVNTGSNSATYNMAGQRVSSNYKGIVIKDGKKKVNK